VTLLRSFRNRDLPALADVWIRHWSAVRQTPRVGVATIELAILSRTFFDPRTLLVAQEEHGVVGWCHFQADRHDPKRAVLNTICFTPDEGLKVCDELLRFAEASMVTAGFEQVVVGPLRDTLYGYAGLSPIGHGIGVPIGDARTSSLLSRSGYRPSLSVSRLAVSTSPYRPPISRESLQLRRTTRIEQRLCIPDELASASAMSHLDIEQQTLVDHRTAEPLAHLHWWLSDPEAQVMNCSDAIMHLGDIHDRGKLEPAEHYLVSAAIQVLANRRIFMVETAVDQQQTELISQLQSLNFKISEQGQRWSKTLA